MPERKLALVVGENIAARRRKLGISQARLAELLDIGKDAVSRMEKGMIAPKMGRLRDIAGELECSVADLFREPDEGGAERLAAIAEAFRLLSPEKQEAVVGIVAELTRVLGTNKN
jgi:transcriptional regulator with XRE-family HTH domain